MRSSGAGSRWFLATARRSACCALPERVEPPSRPPRRPLHTNQKGAHPMRRLTVAVLAAVLVVAAAGCGSSSKKSSSASGSSSSSSSNSGGAYGGSGGASAAQSSSGAKAAGAKLKLAADEEGKLYFN